MRMVFPVVAQVAAVLLCCGAAMAEELTLKMRHLVYNSEDRTCEATFFLESLSGDVPPGLRVQYATEQDDFVLQRCTFIKMAVRQAEWSCKHGFLDTCESVGTVAVSGAACLDNLRNEVACGPIVIADDDGFLVDKRKK